MSVSDDTEIQEMFDEFWLEHDRDPYCSEELVRWWARHKPQYSRITPEQLAAAGLEVRDGRLFVISTGKLYST